MNHPRWATTKNGEMETPDQALTQDEVDAIIESVQAARRFAELVAASDIDVHVDINQQSWIALTLMREIIVATRDHLIRLIQRIERHEQAFAYVHSLLQWPGEAASTLNVANSEARSS